MLLKSYPSNLITPEGIPFWSSEKKCPHIIVFDYRNKLHMDYIRVTSILVAKMYNIEVNNDIIDEYCSKYSIPEIDIQDKCIALTDEDDKETANFYSNYLNIKLPTKNLPDINIIEFNKDLDLHISFINLSSNLRALIIK